MGPASCSTRRPAVVAESPQLVASEVTETKVSAHLAAWHEHADLYRERGWLLLKAAGTLVEIGFVAPNAAPGFRVMPIAIRLRYDNYDVWPPSLTFIDPLTGQPIVPPIPARKREGEVLRDLIVGGHPETGLPFLCLPGIREYHRHPQHSGDDWLRYRAQGMGAPAVICERIWQYMTGPVTGIGVNIGVGLNVHPGELGELVAARAANGSTGA